jgi:hypothetical protein
VPNVLSNDTDWPSARSRIAGAVDSQGSFWMFGGFGGNYSIVELEIIKNFRVLSTISIAISELTHSLVIN